MKKGLPGLISIAVAVASAVAVIVVVLTARSANEKRIISLVRHVEANETSQAMAMVFDDSSLSSLFGGSSQKETTTTESNYELLHKIGFDTPSEFDSSDESTDTITSMKVVGISENFDENDDSDLKSLSAFGITVKDAAVYDVVIEYEITHSDEEISTVYEEETIGTLNVNGKDCIFVG